MPRASAAEHGAAGRQRGGVKRRETAVACKGQVWRAKDRCGMQRGRGERAEGAGSVQMAGGDVHAKACKRRETAGAACREGMGNVQRA